VGCVGGTRTEAVQKVPQANAEDWLTSVPPSDAARTTPARQPP
jgi:hypothetical protein